MNISIQGKCYYVTFIMVVVAMGLLVNACDDNPADADGDDNGNGDPSEPYQMEGEVNNYDMGERDLYANHRGSFDVGSGTLNEDGSFSFELAGQDVVEEHLQPAGGDTFEEFQGFFCYEQIGEQLDSEHQFTQVHTLAFTYGEDNETALIGLTSDQLSINIYPPSSSKGDYLVRWIYSSKEVSIEESCSEGAEQVDLDLVEGWNEVIFDFSDSENAIQHNGEVPSEAGWEIET